MTEYPDACPECGVRQGFGKCSTCLVRHGRGINNEEKWISGVIEYLQAPRDELRQRLLAWAKGKSWDEGPPLPGANGGDCDDECLASRRACKDLDCKRPRFNTGMTWRTELTCGDGPPAEKGGLHILSNYDVCPGTFAEHLAKEMVRRLNAPDFAIGGTFVMATSATSGMQDRVQRQNRDF